MRQRKLQGRSRERDLVVIANLFNPGDPGPDLTRYLAIVVVAIAAGASGQDAICMQALVFINVIGTKARSPCHTFS